MQPKVHLANTKPAGTNHGINFVFDQGGNLPIPEVIVFAQRNNIEDLPSAYALLYGRDI